MKAQAKHTTGFGPVFLALCSCMLVVIAGAGCARVGSQAVTAKPISTETGSAKTRSDTGQAWPAKVGGMWTNTLMMRLAYVPAGEFLMGSPASEIDRFGNETRHAVKLSRGFWLGVTHVTVGQFAAFVRESGYRTAAEKDGWAYGAWNDREKKWDKLDGGSWKNPGFEQGPDHPVVCINWHDATAFCDWLSAREGRRYRLPTEAEWEYACRAGGQTAYPWGDNPDDGKGWANGSDQTARNRFNLFPPFNWSDGYLFTSPVASFKANASGLHDMIGNALQWCGDWFGEYPDQTVVDPQGPADGKNRVLRGGSFVYGPRHCRCAFRGRNLPEFRNFYVGFRVLAEDENSPILFKQNSEKIWSSHELPAGPVRHR